MMVRYLLDANSYIAAKNFHYRMHIVPGFWDWLDTQAENGQVASVEMVRTELLSYGDSLAEWAKHRDSHFLAIDDITTQQCFADDSKKVKIPNVCRHFDLKCCDVYDLLDRLSAKFVLQKHIQH